MADLREVMADRGVGAVTVGNGQPRRRRGGRYRDAAVPFQPSGRHPELGARRLRGQDPHRRHRAAGATRVARCNCHRRAVQDRLPGTAGDEVAVVSAFQNVAAAHLQEGASSATYWSAVTRKRRAGGHHPGRPLACRGFHAGMINNAAAAEALTSVLISINSNTAVTPVSRSAVWAMPDGSPGWSWIAPEGFPWWSRGYARPADR